MSTISVTKSLSHLEKFTIGVLFCINLLNYIDRNCISGVLLDVQLYFDIEDDLAGLIQTGYLIGYTIAAPIYGYLGDRHSRKFIVIVTLIVWIVMGFLNTVVHSFVLFILTRAIVGVSESGFTVLVPSMIADLVTEGSRTLIFAIFYFGVPVGSGLGMAISAKMNQYAKGQWWWGLRATPFLNVFCLIMMIFTINPKRGEKDAAALGGNPAQPTSYIEDLHYLFKSRSFILITMGFTCVEFMMAALGWWGPKSLSYGIVLIEGEHGTDDGVIIGMVGIISIVTGILGVAIGSGLSKWLRPKFPFVDPIIVGVGLFLSMPFYTTSLYYTPINMTTTMVFSTLGQLSTNFNWAVVMDMLMYVVVPTRRSSAKGIQTFVTHILGNTVSTTLVGVLSEAIQDRNDFTSWHSQISDSTTKVNYGETAQNFYGLQYALFSIESIFLVGALIFFVTAIYIVEDKEKAAEESIQK